MRGELGKLSRYTDPTYFSVHLISDTMDKTSFFEDVFEVAKLIPKGRVTSYGAIAEYLGLKSSARMVGWAMNQAHLEVPAQRVVNRKGLLSGKHHFGTPARMQELLEADGVKVVNDQIVNFEEIFWDPVKELGL